MTITVLRKMEYDDHIIYVMQFGQIFQYLFADGCDIYQDYIEVRPTFISLIKYYLGISKSLYSQEDLETGEQIVLSGAMKSIDALKQK